MQIYIKDKKVNIKIKYIVNFKTFEIFSMMRLQRIMGGECSNTYVCWWVGRRHWVHKRVWNEGNITLELDWSVWVVKCRR